MAAASVTWFLGPLGRSKIWLDK